VEKVDALTVGAGGGAYPGAFRLARAGRRVVMVDPKGVMSGNCLADGCIPSKSVREVADLYRRARRGQKFGLAGATDFNYAAVIAHKDGVQIRRYQQHDRELAEMGDRLRLVKGTARFLEPHVVEVPTDDGTHRYSADSIIIASGAEVAVPPIPGAELCLTSSDIFALRPKFRRLPQRMVIIGAGYIALETACMLSVFGVGVSVLVRSQVLRTMDPDFVSQLMGLFDPGIELVFDAEVGTIDRDEKAARVHYRQHGREQVIEAEQVMMAAGRKPVIPEGCEEVGVNVEHGRILVDATLQTSVPRIYACGDVNARSPLFHSAVRQSLVAAHNILSGNVPSDYMDFESVPTTLFTFPEAAYVGITRDQARRRGLSVVEAPYPFAEDTRAQIYDETAGELRLFFEAGSLRVLGGWVIGIDAGNLIGEIGLAVSSRLTAHDLARYPDQHPMASEGVSKAARSLF